MIISQNAEAFLSLSPMMCSNRYFGMITFFVVLEVVSCP
jgi:hypothetical protein